MCQFRREELIAVRQEPHPPPHALRNRCQASMSESGRTQLARTPLPQFPDGRVRSVFTADVGGAVASLTQALMAGDAALRLVTQGVREPTGSHAFPEQLVRGLAEAALLLWPDWYGGTLGMAADATVIEAALADPLAARSVRSTQAGVVLPWVTAAVAACRAGRVPYLPTFPLAVQADQLARALRDERLQIVVFLHERTICDLHGLAQALEWLARETAAAVVAVLPATLTHAPELDRIAYAALWDATAAPNAAGPPGTAAENQPVENKTLERQPAETQRADEQTGRVCPVVGRPHPASPGECKLAAFLEGDAELAGLFGFNQRVTSVLGSRFLVDLLWPAGRVVVEIDGYGYHSSRAAFSADRTRDYELTLSGYLVLRLPHDFVVEDVALAAERVRALVHFRTRYPPPVPEAHA